MMRLFLGWLLCAVLTYGMALASFQAQWTYEDLCNEHGRQDASMAALMALASPLSTVAVLGCSGFAEHGLLFWPDPARCAAQAQAAKERR